MPERKSIYFHDGVLGEIQLRVGSRSHKTSTVVTDGLGWYFRLLSLIGMVEMNEFFSMDEVRVLVGLAASLRKVDANGGLLAARAAMVEVIRADGANRDLARKISGISPGAVIWLLDRLTIVLAHPAEDMDDERVAALFMVKE